MLDTINRDLLIKYGLVQITPNPAYFTEHNGANEVWRYKNAFLTVDKSGHEIKYTFASKESPEFKMGVKNQLQLANILKQIDAGMITADMFVQIQESRAREVEMMTRYPNDTPYLEDFRYNDIGGSYFYVLSNPEIKVMMVYDRHSSKAFYYSVEDLRCLENADLTVHTGNQTHSAISFWFLALESYINSLIKLCCIKKGVQFRVYKDQQLHTRLSSLVKLLELDYQQFNKTNIIGKVNEFAQFRNELFRDRYFGEEIEFKKTMFSGIPVLCCQVDIFQSVLIFMEVASLLRFAIKGLDTMPSVIIKNHEVIAWEKLDDCYNRILEPFLGAVLNKQGLATRLDTKLPPIESCESTLFEEGEIECRVIVDQERKYDYTLSRERSNFVDELYHEYLRSLNYTPDTIRFQRVMLRSKVEKLKE